MQSTKTQTYYPSLEVIRAARKRLASIAFRTPTTINHNLSQKFGATIWLKREDLQVVRSYKLRGAYNKISGLSDQDLKNGVVCASAGNHAQGVAYACQKLQVHARIFMPETTPKQKVAQVKMFGGSFVEVHLSGDTFDDSLLVAKSYCQKYQVAFIHPFDDPQIIEGQATIACEILDDCSDAIDYLLLPAGGGGLAAGVSAVFKYLSPATKIIAVEPEGAASLTAAFAQQKAVALDKVDKFVDGAAVKKVGDVTFGVCKENIAQVLKVPEGLICRTMLQLYNEEAMVVEPAGALSIAALHLLGDLIQNKKVLCIVSGGNNDISRTEEIRERALLHEQLKHYFIINFPQRAGALKEFVADILGDNDDIVYFQYIKKNNREKGPAMVGIELVNAANLAPLLERMKQRNFLEKHLNHHPGLFNFLV